MQKNPTILDRLLHKQIACLEEKVKIFKQKEKTPWIFVWLRVGVNLTFKKIFKYSSLDGGVYYDKTKHRIDMELPNNKTVFDVLRIRRHCESKLVFCETYLRVWLIIHNNVQIGLEASRRINTETCLLLLLLLMSSKYFQVILIFRRYLRLYQQNFWEKKILIVKVQGKKCTNII